MPPAENVTTSSKGTSEFVFATCAPDSNDWLKRDVSALHPELRLAFSRQGFVSWKGDGLVRDFVVQSPVATVSGWGCGQAKDLAHVTSRVEELLERWPDACVHVFGLAQDEASETLAAASESALCAGLSTRGLHVTVNRHARAYQHVIDVIVMAEQQWFVGWHVQREDKYMGPGGVRATPVDDSSPSRAYSKVAELLSLGELSVRSGNTVVELGAAPGGATLYLLQQGAKVWAIDPAPLAERVVEYARLQGDALVALEMAAGDVAREHVPKHVDYLVSDVNLAPTVSLRYLERLCALTRGPKRGVLVNVKINDEKAERMLPLVLSKAKALGERWGLPHMRVAQLPSHRRELGLVLRRAATTTKPSAPIKGNQG